MKRYKKSEDEKILQEINEVLKERPSYGYKRVTAIINKFRFKKNERILNKKRVYRIMDINGLLFKQATSRRGIPKTGIIKTLHSNTRWCSDGFEIHCFNGEKIYVAFSLDCHDRVAISYVAEKRPLVAKDIQDLMLLSVEKRFNTYKTPRMIQWLSDRGSIYRAKETVQTGHYLGLKSCFTAAYSPESNGMSEAFVGTIKRDYVYVSDCCDADSVLKMLPDWFQDYNCHAPHSALGMKSPMEYVATKGVM